MSEWKLIDSAPKDGTWVLLAGGKTSEDFYRERKEPACVKRPVVAMWEASEPDWDGREGYWVYDFWDGRWRSDYESPTHWMHLPPPPEA
jgi:hypothetical protein